MDVAVRKLDAVSGLRFYVAGATTAHPSNDWGSTPVAGSGGWPPVLVGWGVPGDGFLGDESGLTRVTWVTTTAGQDVIVTAAVEFNERQNALWRPGSAGAFSRTALIEHEFGHVAGLDHVSDPTQLMFPEVGAVPTYGAGDAEGLARLGRGPCIQVPDP